MDISLTSDFNSFKTELETFIKNGKEINVIVVNNDKEFTDLTSTINLWTNDCLAYLSTCFTGSDKEFLAKEFKQLSRININKELFLPQKVQITRHFVSGLIFMLEHNLKLISVSDIIVNPARIIDESRANFTTSQKKILLLSKLKELNDRNVYDVGFILETNGIKLNHNIEPREIASSLEKQGLLRTLAAGGVGISAAITIEGVEYIEEIETKENNKTASSDISYIKDKLDEVIELLKKNNIGDERKHQSMKAEMENAGSKLDFKNWGQLLKGKVIEMALEEGIKLGTNSLINIVQNIDLTKLIT